MKTRHALLILLALVTAAGAAEPKFAGTWKSSFGTLRMTQTKDQVEGTYVSSGQLCSLTGKAKGRKLTFTYRESTVTGEGSFELAAEGKSFTGKWRAAGTTPWGEWTGQRIVIKTAASPRFDGVWTSSFGRLRLVQTGKNVTGSYAYSDGSSLSGTVEGRRMTFTYSEPTTGGEAWFDLSDDGEALHGKWKAKGQTPWKDWNAVRVRPKPGLIWLHLPNVLVKLPHQTRLAAVFHDRPIAER